MPSRSTDNWRPQKNEPPRRGQAQGRSGGEYWKQPDGSKTNIYATVDSWRSYGNGHGSLQSREPAQAGSDEVFGPLSQVLPDRAYTNVSRSQAQNRSQVYSQDIQQHDGQTGRGMPQTQLSRAESPPLSYSHIADNGQDQRGAARSSFMPYEPVRFSNGVHERQHAYGPGSGLWRGNSQTTFRQQIPFRSTRGADRSRGYATSPDRPVQSVEHGHTNHTSAPTGYERFHRNGPRQGTPRRREENTASARSAPPAPCATEVYLAQAHLLPEKLDKPKKLLVILDLNGTLMLKPDFRKRDDIRVRPGAPKLLEYLFAHHTVMVYTSGQPHNAELISRRLFSAKQYDLLAAIWARDKLDLTPAQYRDKVQVYKKLDKVWNATDVQASYFPAGQGRWNQTNTILVDDSHLKALQEPHNLLQVPEFTNIAGGRKRKAFEEREKQICQSLVMKLEVLKWQSDVSRLIWRWQTGKAEIPRVPGSDVFVDEKVDQKEQARRDLEAAINLPTPKSPDTSDVESSEDEGVRVLPADQQAAVTAERRSESPIDEAVFKELLGRGKEVVDMPTPTSLDG